MSTQGVPQPDAGQFQYVKLPDGSYGKFAANATDDVIKGAIQKDFPDAFTPTAVQQAANRTGYLPNTSMSAGTQTFDQAHPNAAPKPPGIMRRFASGVGIPTSQAETTQAVQGLLTPQADPNEQSTLVRGLEQVPVLGGDFRARSDLSKRADQESGTGVGIAHRIASLFPLVGPAVTAAQDKYDQGDYAGAAGAGLSALFSMEGLKGAVTPKPAVVNPEPSLKQLTNDAAARKPFTPPAPPLKRLAAGPTITPPPPDTSGSVPYTPPPVAATSRAQRLGLLLPENTASPIELRASSVLPPEEPEGMFPAASRVVYDPVTGQSRVQFLTSRAADSNYTPQDSQLLNDPRGAFAKYAQEQDLGGLADPLAANNPNPITNPIKPASTLPAWASEVQNWEQADPQHLFNQMDEHGFLNHLRQEEIQQWMAEHDKQPEPFQSNGLKTSDKAKQPGLMRNAQEQTSSAAQPQVPTDANTEDLLAQSIAQANAKKNGPGLMANNQPQQATRAIGQPPVSSKVGGAKVLKGDVPLTGPVSPRNAEISRLQNELKTVSDSEERAGIQQAIDYLTAGIEGRPYNAPEQAAVEHLPAPADRPPGPKEVKTVAVSRIDNGEAGTVDTSSLSLDPKRFQYKTQGIGEGGVSNSLKGQPYNPDLAGVISVWTDPADGKTYVVNGHHRFDLAQESGQQSMLVRKLTAGSAKEARAQGALINIAEGRGTAYDAARFFQDSGYGPDELGKHGISLSEAKASDGLALSKLDPSLLDKVGSGKMQEQRGIAIGQATADPAQQEAIVKLIDKQEAKGRKVNNDTVAELARFVANSGNKTIEQGGLFGANQEIHSLALDKAELSASIKQQLGKEKAVFGAVADQGKAQILSRVKDQAIKATDNAKISQQAGQDLELYDKLSTTKGPVNDILESVAKDKANGYITPEQARQRAFEQIRAELRKANPGGTGTDSGGSQTRPGFPAPPK